MRPNKSMQRTTPAPYSVMPVALPFNFISGKERNSALSWFVLGSGRKQQAFARLLRPTPALGRYPPPNA